MGDIYGLGDSRTHVAAGAESWPRSGMRQHREERCKALTAAGLGLALPCGQRHLAGSRQGGAAGTAELFLPRVRSLDLQPQALHLHRRRKFCSNAVMFSNDSSSCTDIQPVLPSPGGFWPALWASLPADLAAEEHRGEGGRAASQEQLRKEELPGLMPFSHPNSFQPPS